jgi:hypothetical protein
METIANLDKFVELNDIVKKISNLINPYLETHLIIRKMFTYIDVDEKKWERLTGRWSGS